MLKEDTKKLTLTFIKFLQEYPEAYLYSDKELTEVFRYSLCSCLGLQSMYVFNENKYIRIINCCKAELQPVIKEFVNLTDKEKTDIVQMCMHYITLSWERVGVQR